MKLNDRVEGKLFVSSLHLFNNIKQAMNRCLSFSKSKTFFDLTRKFKEVFNYYNDKILYANKIRTSQAEKEKLKLNDEDLKYVCYVINTSDYCITTVNSLVDSLRDKIDEKYKNQVCFDDSVDFIKSTYKIAFEIMMQYLRNIFNEQFISMTKLTWTFSGLSPDIGQFVINIQKNSENMFLVIKDILQEGFLYHILNSIPDIIYKKFLENLYKIKKIDEAGAQKLLIDVYEMKGMITKLYSLISGIPLSSIANKENDFNYVCLNMAIKKEFGKIESRLKCLGSSVNEMGNAYKTFVEDKSKDDFDKLLQIKGVKKSEISEYEKIFN